MDKQQKPLPETRPFESDSAKLFHRHLSDSSHVITDEEMASVRVGMTPSSDEATDQAVQDAGERMDDKTTDKENENVHDAQKNMPWELIE